MVRYYGFYSNVARGKRKKNEQDELIPSILEPDGSSGKYKRNWARLIKGTPYHLNSPDHAGNYWKNRRGGYLFSHGYEGYKFPEEKQRVLALIDEGLDCRQH